MFGRGIGPWELVLILLIALLIFGPSKLPEMAKALGRSMREFKRATKEITDEVTKATDVEDDEATKTVKS